MTREIAILGGAFDPPHLGHLSIARKVRQHGNVSEVLLMPCWAHMYGKQMASAESRLTMCQLMVAGEHNIGVSDLEIAQRLSGETFFLVQKLRELKNLNFSLIVGQDNGDEFQNWFRYRDLQQMVKFIVVPRGQMAPSADAWYRKPPHQFLDVPVPDISSTQIRDYISGGDSSLARDFVSPEVYTYIVSNSLYREKFHV